MDKFIEKRVLQEANHIIKTKDTIRKTAESFNVSKSTIHNDLKNKKKKIDQSLANEISLIFKNHDENKHIRGGEATKNKYKKR